MIICDLRMTNSWSFPPMNMNAKPSRTQCAIASSARVSDLSGLVGASIGRMQNATGGPFVDEKAICATGTPWKRKA